MFLFIFFFSGEYTVMYLYLRYRFHFNEEMYSLFLAYGCIGISFGNFFSQLSTLQIKSKIFNQIYAHVFVILGTLICSVILSKILKIHDGILATFASIWDFGIIVAYIFATVKWQLYLSKFTRKLL